MQDWHRHDREMVKAMGDAALANRLHGEAQRLVQEDPLYQALLVQEVLHRYGGPDGVREEIARRVGPFTA